MSITSKFAPLSLLLAVAALLILSGCKSSGATHGEGASATADAAVADNPTTAPAIYCDKCKTTFARVPVTGGSTHGQSGYGVISYRTVAEHECDECRSVASGIIMQGKTTRPGKVVHTCKICGGSMTVCHTS